MLETGTLNEKLLSLEDVHLIESSKAESCPLPEAE